MVRPAGAPFDGAFAGKTVLVTGHTGFKGAWLCLWLHRLGARVVGYALQPPAGPSLFVDAGVEGLITHLEGDVRDAGRLQAALAEHRPEVVMHLAAQPLVRESYRAPVETFDVNVMGTVHLLEAVRHVDSVKACVVVTSDKCYDNREWAYGYRENDPMGGHDPYSASKGCAELVADSYRRSFFEGAARCGLATARAGNVIGGGDWAEDRIVPDVVRALKAGRPIPVRNPASVRPWQHVLEPLSGYLWLAARMLHSPASVAEAWNFGPAPSSAVPVRRLVEVALAHWGGGHWEHQAPAEALHEAHYLKLDTTKAASQLAWEPLWSLEETLGHTMAWYAASDRAGFEPAAFTSAQIAAYEALAAERRVRWGAASPHPA